MTLQEVKDKLVAVGLDISSVTQFSGPGLVEAPMILDIALRGPLTYGMLGQVAEALGTDRIDVDSDARSAGSYLPQSWVTLRVFGVLDNA